MSIIFGSTIEIGQVFVIDYTKTESNNVFAFVTGEVYLLGYLVFNGEEVTMNIVDKFYDQAQKELMVIIEKLPLTSAILDNWGGAIRIVYGADFVNNCSSECEECPLFKIVGVDSPDLKPDNFVTTLRLASKGALDVFPSKQRFLNCKTLEQYLGAIIAWLVEKCEDNQSIATELDLARGFRILLAEEDFDLSVIEKASKKYVVEESLRRMNELDSRRDFLYSYAKKIGLIE